MGRTRIWDIHMDGLTDGQPGDYMLPPPRNFSGSIKTKHDCIPMKACRMLGSAQLRQSACMSVSMGPGAQLSTIARGLSSANTWKYMSRAALPETEITNMHYYLKVHVPGCYA